MSIKLTQYSHGAGCGCKIAPNVLEEIIGTSIVMPDNARLLVGNHSKDDAAAYDLGNGQALISTTDFFMPIVDDPYEFGRIASANAISDVYAMGGRPVLAIAILGWPISVLSTEVARKVIEGAQSMCIEAGIPLAGGHSIDAPEPIFGLAVSGLADIQSLKQNNTAKNGDLLYLTKPLGVGILTTSEKKGILKIEHTGIAARQMMQLNKVGEDLGKVNGVNAMTDVTGFGLLGHLVEMCEGSGLSAQVSFQKVPKIIPGLQDYLDQKSIPGGTGRNMKAYGSKVSFDTVENPVLAEHILADPQTSGGLLIAVAPAHREEVEAILHKNGLSAFSQPIGNIHPIRKQGIFVEVI
ncbi:MAG: selenide, water dikinase SelD [Saprospiraceae bacterium]|nr:selenide, water dikinase SelD [Saprospiraceae bacterium]